MKKETRIARLLNETLKTEYIRNGFYSAMRSPKGYPLQYDFLCYYVMSNGAWRPIFAIEYQGIQHKKAIYGKRKLMYQQKCDQLKQRESDKLRIKLIYMYHDERISAELLFRKLNHIKLLKRMLRLSLIKDKYILLAHEILFGINERKKKE